MWAVMYARGLHAWLVETGGRGATGSQGGAEARPEVCRVGRVLAVCVVKVATCTSLGCRLGKFVKP